MAKKIEGFAAHNRENLKGAETYFEFFAEDFAGRDPWKKATLVIGDERVFTESEVKAMLMDAFRGYDRTGEGVTWERIKPVASEHGISFDPA